MTADGVLANTVDKRPRVFGITGVGTKKLRLFKVDKQYTETLGEIIADNFLPGATIHSGEWAAYNSTPNLVDAGGLSMNYVWQTVNHLLQFMEPGTGAHTQNIEGVWQKAKRRLVKNGQKVNSSRMSPPVALGAVYQWKEAV